MSRLAELEKLRSSDPRQRAVAIGRGWRNRAQRKARYPLAWATANQRLLPSFLIAGAQRSGTTSLYDWLSAHPQVLPSVIKEVHYFDDGYAQGERWYRSHFPLQSTAGRAARTAGGPVQTGDASPYYLFHPLAAERAASLLPDAKTVLLLRNPVERAISSWSKAKREGKEPLDFPAAVEAEPQRLAGAAEAIISGGPGARNYAHREYSYVARGRYAGQIRHWLQHFDRSQLLVVQSEHMFDNPAETYDSICAFLGLRTGVHPSFGALNSNRSSGRPEWRQALAGVFDDDVADLQQLLGQQFDWALPEK